MDSLEKAFLQELAQPEGLDSWKNRPEDQRNSFVSVLSQARVISPAEVYLLDWLPRSEHFTLTDYLAFSKIINGIRTRLLEKMDTEQPPESEPPPSTEQLPIIPQESATAEIQHYNYRLLSEEEIIDRFANLGVDILKVFSDWFNFYWRANYGENEFGENYYLAIPDLTSEAMDAFEQAWMSGDIDTIMIDDARIPDGNTLKYFQKKTSKKSIRTCNQFRPIAPESMLNFLDGQIVNLKKGDPLTSKERRRLMHYYEFDDISDRGVRIVGLKTGFGHIDFKRHSFREARNLLGLTYTNNIEFGTWVRFLHFLRYNNRAQYNHFLDNITRINGGSNYAKPEVLLNSFTPYGEFVTATAYRNHIGYHTKANPSSDPTDLTPHVIPFVVIQSDAHPEGSDIDDDDNDDIPF